MAKLTPLAKGLFTVIILGGATTAAWHLGLKELVQGKASSAQAVAPSAAPVAAQAAPQASKPKAVKSNASAPLGSAANPLKVSIVSFHGYAPALVANGNSLVTQTGSIYDKLGVHVQLVIQDDIPTLTTIFESGTAQCAWRTSDFWAQEHPNLRNAGLDAKAVVVVDNTQGADAVITRNPNIRRIEDLAGHSVALLQFTPSDGMLIDALENSSLTARQKQSVRMVYLNAEEGTAGVRAALESGNVDAAALWDPDLSLALKNIQGAQVIYSTKTATNLIYDVMVCDQRALANPAYTDVFQGFVTGWLQGVDVARKNPQLAVDALVKNEEFFTLLAKDEGNEFIKSLFDNIVWTGLEDNARILGFTGTTNHYERVYRRFDGIYRGVGALANPASPVINPQDSFDYRFVRKLFDASQEAQVAAAKPEFTFSEQERSKAIQQKATVTKPVIVNFQTGSSALNKRAMRTIDQEMVPLIESNGSAYFEVSGNSDSTGARDVNLRISKERAQAVVNYLVKEWEFDASRFYVTGYGSDRPLCNEKNPAAEDLSLEDCRARNRSTRVAVLSR